MSVGVCPNCHQMRKLENRHGDTETREMCGFCGCWWSRAVWVAQASRQYARIFGRPGNYS